MRLLTVEMTRLRWRRGVLMLLLAAVFLPVLFWGATTWETRPVSETEVAAAKAQAREDAQAMAVEFDRCQADPEAYAERIFGEPIEGESCENLVGDPAEMGEYIWYLPRQPLEFEGLMNGAALGISVILVMLVLLMGATFAGADWTSGSMSNQLLFESRRTRVWFTKAAAIGLSGLAVAVLALALFWGLFTATFALREIDLSSGQWGEAASMAARTAVAAGLAGVAGYAMTMLFRSTIATLAVVLLTVVGSSLVIGVLPFAEPERWMIHANGLAVLQNGYQYYPASGDFACQTPDCSDAMLLLPLSHGVLYFLVILLVIGVASVLSFRGRDIP